MFVLKLQRLLFGPKTSLYVTTYIKSHTVAKLADCSWLYRMGWKIEPVWTL